MARVKITAVVRLFPDRYQHAALLHTLECSNQACNRISEIAWEYRTFRQYDLHKLLYAQIRQQTGLTAQVVVRCIAKVVDAYKLDRDTLQFQIAWSACL